MQQMALTGESPPHFARHRAADKGQACGCIVPASRYQRPTTTASDEPIVELIKITAAVKTTGGELTRKSFAQSEAGA
jgi:hypothetical protein